MSSSSFDDAEPFFENQHQYFDSIDIPSEDIDSATNNFADENLVRQTSSSKTYKGRLMVSSGKIVDIVLRKLHIYTAQVEAFMLKDLRHKNIMPIFKFCLIEEEAAVIINKHQVNESLDKHLSSSSPSTLSWMQRLRICVGIAQALSYLHYDAKENHSVIHCNIKSSKILLNRHWEPKLHGFRFAVEAKRDELYYIDEYKGSILYMDPAYETTRGLTNKSDVFSFGVVLFEVLFGMEAAASVVVPSTPDHKDNLHFARMAQASYEEKTLDDMIHPDLREQMNLKSLNIFSETAYFCLKEQWSQRPDTKKVLQRLKIALEFQRKHESPEHSKVGEGTSSDHVKVKTLDHLTIPLKDIKLATDNFSDVYCIGSGGFGTVYKATLDHFDDKSSLTVNKGEKKVALPKRRSIVAIKRIFTRVDGQAEKGFLAEIELLSKCKHPNIVSLIGFCNEETEMILIYEYATNGSLEAYLGNAANLMNLTWAKRIKISIDIAHGLHYLHTSTEDKECIIHRDIKSANILLGDKWEAKIADFGLSKLHPTYNQRSTLVSGNIGGTQVYLDPEYERTGHLKTSSDIYSFGVVLCEIMSGNLAYDNIYNELGLPSIIRQSFRDKSIEALVDPRIKDYGKNTFVLNDGINRDSLYTFSEIASQCVAEAQVHRPRMQVVLKELEKSFYLQNNNRDNRLISLEAIKLGTQDFSDCNCTGKGRFWRRYEGEISVADANERTRPIVAKRFDNGSDEGIYQFITELKLLFECSHKNIVGVVGYCNEMGEKIIVYEHADNGTLDQHLRNADLTWTRRLKIGLDVARGLEYLQAGGIITKDSSSSSTGDTTEYYFTPMIHGDMKSSSITLDRDWRAKLSNLEESSNSMERKEVKRIDDDNAYGSLSYIDPRYKELGFLDAYSDVYSLGVVLMEMLLGRLARPGDFEDYSVSLDTIIEDNTINNKEHIIVPRSLDVYSTVTSRCLESYPYSRPSVSDVIKELTLALAYQEDYEIWEPKFPKDYEKLSDMSWEGIIPGWFKDFYDMLYQGFVFQDGKTWFSLGSNGKRNVMISAKKLSYTNRRLRRWRKSRFLVVAKMLDISNLKVQIKIKPQFLLPGDNYDVYLVFKFCERGKRLAKKMYVNLKYKRGSDSLHSAFATWREDGWMMIELGQILNCVEDTEFEFLLESFSRSYCGSSIYIEGIEFRTIDNGYEQDKSIDIKKYQETQKYEEIKKPKEVQHFPIDSKEIFKSSENANKGFLLKQEQNEKIFFMISKMEFPYESSIATPFHLTYPAESSIQGEIELSKQQVFGIKGKIESQMLSPDADYMCYLVFKLSETCHGLHCPVKVRNVLQWKNKEIGLICFRPPISWNLSDKNGAPKERDDGWMEVHVWKFNSKSTLRSNHIPMYLKFITYEGTMSGLILSGLEIRPM